MGVIYAMKCDFCGRRQSAEKSADIKGETLMVNSVQKFACAKCIGIVKAAFECGAKGLENPLVELARVTQERDEARRQLTRLRGPWTEKLPAAVRPDLRKLGVKPKKKKGRR